MKFKITNLLNKKYLPIIVIIVGLGILTSAILVIRARNTAPTTKEGQATTKEVALEDRPIASLVPSADGHWLKLSISKIQVKAETMDYELLYQLPDGRTQGVPGTITLKDEETIERDLLLGSESSGRFRYDEGVSEGSLTLRFRDGKGKLITKFTTKFRLQSGDKELTSVEGGFTYTISKAPGKDFFVTMGTFGIPADVPGEVASGPFGIFSSATSAVPGSVTLGTGPIYRADGSKWQKLEGGNSSDIGIFIGTSE